MSWQCPECNRRFKNHNQDHSCGQYSVEEHFENKDVSVFNIFQEISRELQKNCQFDIHAVKNAILFWREVNFIAFKPRKRWLDIEFVLQREVNEFPVNKVVQASKTQFAHFVRLQYESEIDDQLLAWLYESYQFAKSRQ